MIRSLTFILLIGAVCTSPVVIAEGEADDAVTPEDGVASRTVVRESMTRRDPFWPVGYLPTKTSVVVVVTTPEADPPNWRQARRQIKVIGISTKGGRSYAVLGGGMGVVEAGDVVGVRDALYLYKFRIKSISRQGLQTEQVEAIQLKK